MAIREFCSRQRRIQRFHATNMLEGIWPGASPFASSRALTDKGGSWGQFRSALERAPKALDEQWPGLSIEMRIPVAASMWLRCPLAVEDMSLRPQHRCLAPQAPEGPSPEWPSRPAKSGGWTKRAMSNVNRISNHIIAQQLPHSISEWIGVDAQIAPRRLAKFRNYFANIARTVS